MPSKKKTKKLTVKTKLTKTKDDYFQALEELKEQVVQAQMKASFVAHKELTFLYWLIGKTITEKQDLFGWGKSIIERLGKDLQNAFPGIAGFSRTNIFRMRAFFVAYQKNPTAVGQLTDLPVFMIPWGHNAVILERVKDTEKRLWYAQKSLEHGWSRNLLELWIKSDLYRREGKAITNFKVTLPASHSDLAHQSLKDPYLFDFLTLHQDHMEKEIEQGLIDHIQKFLLELGQGFAFLGRQVHIQVDEVDYYIDLLFYHTRLRCYLVVELKARAFDPRDVGQINFYLSAVDSLIKHPDDKPTIGLLLCKSKKNLTVEYALRGSVMPVGVASYETKLVEKLPKNFKSSLPTVETIEAELKRHEIEVKKQKKMRMKKKMK